MSRKQFVCLVGFAFVALSAHANPKPAPEQTVGMYSGVVLALVCEIAVVLFLLRKYHFRTGVLCAFLCILNALTFTGAFETPWSQYLYDIGIPGSICLLLVEGSIVLCEAIFLYFFVRLPVARSTQSLNISFLTAVTISCIGNVTSFVAGWFLIKSFMWFFWWFHGHRGAGYFRSLMEW